MCGIAGIVLKNSQSINLSDKIRSMTYAIAHRGPDGEGFILADTKDTIAYSGYVPAKFSNQKLKYIPKSNLPSDAKNSFLAFGHRRLSIIDLSETGHQPMCDVDNESWIVFNGEIYNYLELKRELTSIGCRFVTDSDTEVVLEAYKMWGQNCVKKLDGMWAFCIYDREKNICFASRDRLGVKPFYFINNKEFFAFASEQKAFVKSGLVKAKINDKALHDYLTAGVLEGSTQNFFEGVEELFPGHNLLYSLKDNKVSIKKYYSITVTDINDRLNEKELIEKISERLYRSVQLRMRSDVEVGTCLSGGIDSSVLSGLMHKITGNQIYCFTSVFDNKKANEEGFADLMAQSIHAKHKKVEPNIKSFVRDLNNLIYSQDVPIWDTSTYAQFKTMQLAKEYNIKVVLDGQGADELFAGYHHHYVAKWNNLFKTGKRSDALKDINEAKKTIKSPLVFYAKEKVKQKRNLNLTLLKKFYTRDFLQSARVENQVIYFNSVNEQLIHDIERARLKTFLKCEDRCGMWHGVESRTPFSDDVELIDLMFSFNGNKKIKNGISKYLLREAAKDVLPKQIYKRYDKMGFETPMHEWLKLFKKKMLREVSEANPHYVNFNALSTINANNFNEMKLLFKLFVLVRWKQVFEAS